MKFPVQEIVCTAALCVFSTGVYATQLDADLAQAKTDYTAAKQECKKIVTGSARTDCYRKASAANKKHVAEIKADAKKTKAEADALQKKAVDDANAKQLKTVEDANAAAAKAKQ